MQSLELEPEATERMLSRVHELTQLKVTSRNRSVLERVASERARALGIGIDEWVSRLDGPGGARELEHVIVELTVGETYLFRGPVFDTLREHALPELVARRRAEGSRVLRLLSAGCATGEEAYSLAIAASEAIGNLSGWHVSVLGLDVNNRFLERAEEATYGHWSTRDVRQSVLDVHFERDGDQWRVRPEIRTLVRFQYANLATDPLPAPALGVVGMDVVVCQNVLYYFEPDARARVITGLSHALSPQGYLCFGPADLVTAAIPNCQTTTFGDVSVYRRVGRVSAAQRRRPSLPSLAAVTETAPPRAPEVDVTPSERSYPPRFAMALALANDGDVVGSIGELEALLARDRDHVAAHVLHGFLLAELSQLEPALDAFRRAIYLDQESLLAHIGALTAARRLGRVALMRRFESRVRALAASRAPSAHIEGWDGMTVERLLSLFRDDAEDRE